MPSIEFLSSIATVAALAIAIWQLYLQRREIERGNRLNALLQFEALLRSQIEARERVIEGLKAANRSYAPLADKGNRRYRPVHRRIEQRIFAMACENAPDIDLAEIEDLLAPAAEVRAG